MKEQVSNSDFLDEMYFMNSIRDYLIALFIILAGIVFIKMVRKITGQKLLANSSPYATYFQKIEGYVYPVFYLLIFYFSFHFLATAPKTALFFHYVFTVGFIFLLVRLLAALIRVAIYSYAIRQDENGEKLRQVRGIVLVLNGTLWIVGLIFLFDNLGFNVTAVLTGLGVGGIAIALAAQTILGDIFNYFVIFLDKPFEVGDFIVVDDKLGTVEYIGLKTTRLKSLQGEQIVFANSNLTNSRIHNYKRMNERRILFKIGVVYDTSRSRLSEIPLVIRAIIEEQAEARFDRAHFASFGDFSLNFEGVYYVLSADYNTYMDIQQNINLKLYEEFENRNIKFAFPTYSINLTNGKVTENPSAQADVLERSFGEH